MIWIRCYSVTKTVCTQTSLLSQACPETLMVVITTVQLDTCLLLILQFVLCFTDALPLIFKKSIFACLLWMLLPVCKLSNAYEKCKLCWLTLSKVPAALLVVNIIVGSQTLLWALLCIIYCFRIGNKNWCFSLFLLLLMVSSASHGKLPSCH